MNKKFLQNIGFGLLFLFAFTIWYVLYSESVTFDQRMNSLIFGEVAACIGMGILFYIEHNKVPKITTFK